MPAETVRLDTYGLTDRGKKRSKNEDQFLVATMKRAMEVEQTSLPTPDGPVLLGKPDATLLVVADGMGGGAAGEVASSLAVQAIAQRLCSFTPFVVKRRTSPLGTVRNLRKDLLAALAEGESSIMEAAAETGGARSMGTTLTLVYLLWPRLYVAHVGDSRCYLLRAGEVQQLTEDHTVAQQLVERGVEVDDASYLHHTLWNALGGESKSQPELCRVDLLQGDVVLLCSDGLTKHVSNAEIAAVLEAERDAEASCRRLVGMANDRGGKDNITVVVARVAERVVPLD